MNALGPASARRGGWLAVLLAALLLGAPRDARGQSTGDQFQDRQLAYTAAKSAYQSALDARNVREKQWNDALEEHQQAHRAGDGAGENAALVRARDLARELDLADKSATAQRKTFDGARTALLAAIDERAGDVDNQLDAARTTGDRAMYAKLLRDLDNQRQQIEADRDEPALKVQLVFYPSIQFDPRDTPDQWTAKAQLLRAKAQRADSAIAQIDRQIAALNDQLRRARNVQSLVTGLERFGDVQPPGGAPNRRNPQSDVPTRPDSAGVSRPQATPQEQILELRLLRLQVLEAKRQFLERAGIFEQRLRTVGN